MAQGKRRRKVEGEGQVVGALANCIGNEMYR